MHILKTDTCPSLSGRSILTYHIGLKNEEIFFSLAENSKPGVLSREWISLQHMETLLAAEEHAFTSRTSALHTLYKGHSINSGGFMACATNGKMRRSPEKIRGQAWYDIVTCHDK